MSYKNKSVEHVYLPNEIFNDLKNNIHISSHIAFAYSYMYYITYLYRYCKYLDENGNKVTQKRIKEYLGYHPSYKNINYIIKRNGLLDSLHYTKSTSNYPIQYLYEPDEDHNEYIIFDTIKNYKHMHNINDKNFKIKKPLKAFYRSNKAMMNRELTGTFYMVENTHRIDYKLFKSMIENDKLGTKAFYIYGYLKHKCSIFDNSYQRSFKKLSDDTGLSCRSIQIQINRLEEYGYIRVDRQLFQAGADLDNLQANIYHILR